MSNKNNNPEQKAMWKVNRKLGSRFMKVVPSYLYNPPSKSPSRRDLHRMEVASRKK